MNSTADLLLKNGLVVTMDQKGTIYESGSIAIQDKKIVALGKDVDKKYGAKRIVDLNGSMVLPGFINTHTHSPMILFRGCDDNVSLQQWLKRIWALEYRYLSPESVGAATELAIAEMIKSGITTFNDMYFYADIIAETAKKAAVRAFVSETILDNPHLKGFSLDHLFDREEQLVEKWKNHPYIQPTIAPHSIYSCCTETLRRVVRFAEKHEVMINIHLAETKEEVICCKKEYGKSPVFYLDSLGLYNRPLIAAHAIYVDHHDIAELALHRVGIAHCPESNMKLASGVAPVVEMLRAHLAVGLGTDGAASNNNLSLFDEMDSAAKLQKLIHKDPAVISAEAVVRMATIDGARVLHIDDKVGSLEVGKEADLIVLHTDLPHDVPLHNVYSQIVFSMNRDDVKSVMVAGKFVMEEGALKTIDEGEVLEKVKKIGAVIHCA